MKDEKCIIIEINKEGEGRREGGRNTEIEIEREFFPSLNSFIPAIKKVATEGDS